MFILQTELDANEKLRVTLFYNRTLNPDAKIVDQLARAIVKQFPCTKIATGYGHVSFLKILILIFLL